MFLTDFLLFLPNFNPKINQNPKNMMKKTLLTTLFATCALTGFADEGMWMLTDLKKQNAAVMQEMGLDLSIDDVYSPDGISLKDAVVHFGGGCTGEVISAEGLVLTNHHCGYGYIQQHSSVEHDYLTDGFWAMTRDEELPCEGLTITYIDRILDVTDYVQDQLKKDKDPEGLNYLSPSYLEKVAARFAKKEKIKTDEFTLRQERENQDRRVPCTRTETFLRSQQILPLREDRLQGHPHGRSTSFIHRQVRRRYRQLDVAPSLRRLLDVPYLCRSRRETGQL